MMRLLSQTTAKTWPRAEVGLVVGIAVCIQLFIACKVGNAQSPVSLNPPNRATLNQLTPPKTTPTELQAPKSAVFQLAPPKSPSVVPLSPPASQAQLTVLNPPAPAAATGSSTASAVVKTEATPPQALELEQMQPAIAAVRTQLEILNPPPPTATMPNAPSASGANTAQSTISSGLTLEGPVVARAGTPSQLVPPPPELAQRAMPRSPTVQTIPASQSSGGSVFVQPANATPPQAPATRVAALSPPPAASLPSPSIGTLPAPKAGLVIQVPQKSPALSPPSSVRVGPPVQVPNRQTPASAVVQQITPPRFAQQPLAQQQLQAQQLQPQAQTQVPPPALEQLPQPQLPAVGFNQVVAQPPTAVAPQTSILENPANVPGSVIINAPEQFGGNATTGQGLGPSILSGAAPMAEATWQFNFQNAPWPLVIRNFAKQNGLALQMLSEPTGQFNFVDERPYPASEALDLLNDYLLNEGFLLIRNGNKLTTVSAGAPVQEGIVPFVPMRQIDFLGRNELASVAIPIKSTEATMVMSEVQPLLSRIGRAQVVSNSSRLVVTDTGAYLRRARDILGGYGLAAGDLQTVVVHLKNTTAEGMAATISAHLGSTLSAASVTTAAGQNGVGGVIQASAVSASGTGLSSTRVIPDRETNSLLISGTPAEVAEVQSLICQLDQARAQVILQGLILEVNLGNVRELGAEVGLQDSVLFNRSVIDNLVTLQQTNTSANGVQTTNQQVVSQTSAPGFNFNNQPLGNNTAISPNVIGAQGLGNLGVGRTNSQLGFGGLVLSASSNSVSLLLRALQANFEVDVLSRPQIRTVDNKEAFIQIGQQVPVVDGVNVTAVGTANPIIRQDQAGIILKMTPNVSPDGLIQIKVSAEKSAFKLQPGTGVPIFTDARNGTVIQAPIKDITTAQATVSARAGQTIVLGGMITRDEETIERRVPGLSRIPLIGRLFRYDFNNVTRKELLIFLTPHIIADDAASDAYKDAEVNRIHAPLERAAEIHGNLLTGPQEGAPVIEQVITPQ